MRLFTFAACLMTMAAPAFAAPVTIETARGPVTLEANPAKVAVYDFAEMDTLGALGVTVAGVPDKVLVPYLKDEAAKAQPVGTLFEPDLEKLSALGPDAIILGGRTAPKYDEVKALAPTLDMTISTDLLKSLHDQLTAYGTLFNKADKAAELTAALDEKVKTVQGLGKDQGKALVLLTNGTKMAAYGLGSRFGWLHTVTGLAEAHPGLKTDTHGNSISYEFIAETDPDWIFVIDRGAAIGADGASASQTLDNPLVAATKAAKNNHIVYLNAADMYLASGGYRSVMEILDELHTALQAK